ncbi:MAG TPA: tRNA epoxyqueuosine(34) reductase QueG [Gammaproteobacteria bacterium]|nr:tRNA epoxyqueuosine(34) reductase QueG [Gammaproteobacteria bacterium]
MTDCVNADQLAERIRAHGHSLGFQQIGIADVDLDVEEARLITWLREQRHGSMHYMARHGRRRTHPSELVPGTLRVISARMDYWPADAADADENLTDGRRAYISRYALGRDYHKLLRKRLQQLVDLVREDSGVFGYRVFTDSAPVMEKPLARNAGLGWIGKHTNLINRRAGSWFFLGEIYTDLPLPVDAPETDHCGSCHACIDVCPTQAITGPYQLDARRCISYLTIENRDAIPTEFRKAIGNRIYGCDDCQLVCPWNKFAHPTAEADFAPRHDLDNATLVELFNWDEATFLKNTEGSAIRRIGYEGWLRNCAVALGNAPSDPEVTAALARRRTHPSALVREHVEWALAQH